MGEISPLPAKGLDPKIFKRFKEDLLVILNWVTQQELGKNMNVQRSNINRYIKGNLPVTKGFLKKFYAAWGDVVNEKNAQLNGEILINSVSGQRIEINARDILAILSRIEHKIDYQYMDVKKEIEFLKFG